MATIKIKRKETTGGSAPTTLGEISCNTADKELFVGDGSAAIKFIDTAAVDTKISTALTSAFSYKGLVAGNDQASSETASSATSLAASPENGDYYKISTKGYVKASGAQDSAAFFVNADDSVVYNGSSWDKLDNTNSTIASSGSSITVSGSADAGFNVEVGTVDGGTYGAEEASSTPSPFSALGTGIDASTVAAPITVNGAVTLADEISFSKSGVSHVYKKTGTEFAYVNLNGTSKYFYMNYQLDTAASGAGATGTYGRFGTEEVAGGNVPRHFYVSDNGLIATASLGGSGTGDLSSYGPSVLTIDPFLILFPGETSPLA